MNPENDSPKEENPQGSTDRMAAMRARVEAAAQRTKEIARASEVISTAKPESIHETPAILMSRARTKAHKDFEYVEDILERGSLINQRKAEINSFEIVPDETPVLNCSREDGKQEITVSEFKKRFL